MKSNLFAKNVRYVPILPPYSPEKVQTRYIVCNLEELAQRIPLKVDVNSKHGALKELRDTSYLQTVNHVYGVVLNESTKIHYVHLFVTFYAPEYVSKIVKKFPPKTQFYRYIRQRPNKRFLTSERIFFTFGGELAPKIDTFFSGDPRLIDVIVKKDFTVYTKKDHLKAKEAFEAKHSNYITKKVRK